MQRAARFYKSEQPYNRALKEMARQIGGPFSKPVLKKVNRGNRQITETKPKSEYMCSHVGRRSFCTNLAKSSVPIPTIQRLSGHKTLKSLQIYLRQSNEEAASMVQELWNNQTTVPPSPPSKALSNEPVNLN